MLKLLQIILICSLPFFVIAQQPDTITKEDLRIAAKVIGIDFTEPERDSMLRDVRDNVREYTKMRSLPLNNSVPMTLWQSPLLPGMKFDTKQLPAQWNIPANVMMPTNKADLAFYSILQLASLIKNKKITSVELTRFFIERIRKYGDTLQCVISVTEEIAMQQAKAADAEIAKGKYRGLLHGIPYGAKDLLAKKGYKTTWGSVPFKDQVLDYDATVITRLEEAGAVLCAKLTLGELAWGDVWFGGTTKNPWNLKRGSSGSSAGSASSVSAGLLPFAIGSETLGSIVSPRSIFCSKLCNVAS